MTFFIILIILVLALRLLMPYLRSWFIRRMQHKAEDYFRAAAGMPPRDKSTGGRKNNSRHDRFSSQNSAGTDNVNMADEMRKVAVDVEFTEVHEYSEDIEISKHNDTIQYKVEQQVSDAEYVVITKTPEIH